MGECAKALGKLAEYIFTALFALPIMAGAVLFTGGVVCLALDYAHRSYFG